MYFSSDFHLGHNAILKYRPQFKNIQEHDEAILSQIHALTKRDVLMILGDFIFASDRYDYYISELRKIKCRIKLVMGNHDSMQLYKESIPYVEIQLPLFSYKNMWVSHAPIHPQEIRNRLGNIHGHLHSSVVEKSKIIPVYGGVIHKNSSVPDERYFNVNLDNNNFKFV